MSPFSAVLRLRLVLLLGFAALGAGFLWSDVSAYRDLAAIADSPRSTTAEVIRLNPSGRQVTYDFGLNGIVFSHTTEDGGGAGNPEFSALHDGSIIVVTYHTANPAISVAGDASFRLARLQATIVITVGAVFLLGVALLYGFFFAGGVRGSRAWRR